MPRICLYCARYTAEQLTPAPLGIGYIAAYLIQQGLVSPTDIVIADSIDQALSFKPDIVGISSVSQVFHNARSFAQACKKAFPCLTVLGGYHVSCMPLDMPEEFDIGIVGEGEKTFAELVERCNSHTLTGESLPLIKGICFQTGEGVAVTGPREVINDIDALPFPHRASGHVHEIGVFTSRGCPYKCIFCASHAFWGDTYRLRSAESVVAEIDYVVRTFQPDIINILDDLWIANKQRFRDIAARLIALRIPEHVSFIGFCRSNIVYEEEVLLLQQLNYKYLRFGAETGSDVLLKRLKGSSVSITDHQRVIDLCYKHGMTCGASFMFGVPGETRDDIEATISFLRTNRGKCKIMGFYLFNPLPGTELWDWMAAHKKMPDVMDFERLQLDFLNEQFSWDTIMYFNNDVVPLPLFRRYIEAIRKEFIDQKPALSPLPGNPVRDSIMHPAAALKRLLKIRHE